MLSGASSERDHEDMPDDLRSAAVTEADTDAGAGLEAVVQVDVERADEMRIARRSILRRLSRNTPL